MELLQNSSFDEIAKTINDALILGSDNDFGMTTSRTLKPASSSSQPDWHRLEGDGRYLQGWLGKGELGVVIAPTGAGKSMALVHIGAQAVKAGKTVVYYTWNYKTQWSVGD